MMSLPHVHGCAYLRALAHDLALPLTLALACDASHMMLRTLVLGVFASEAANMYTVADGIS